MELLGCLWSSSHEDLTRTSATRTTWLWRLLTGADLKTELMLLCLLQLTTLLLALCAAAAILLLVLRFALLIQHANTQLNVPSAIETPVQTMRLAEPELLRTSKPTSWTATQPFFS
jgi:hypothetical protein